MEYTISGSSMPAVKFDLERGEALFTEAGGMAWMKGNVKMETEMPGGLLGGVKRKIAGESFFVTRYTARDQCEITFAPYAPGHIVDIELDGSNEIIMQRDAFMVAENTVKLDMHFRRRLGAAVFGGEGFIMQKLSGRGMAFAEIPGEVVSYNLAAGEEIQVDPGHVAMLEPSVDFDITRIKGVRNIVFGGEGLFLAHLKGPGRIWLQTMTLRNLAAKIASYIPSSG